MRVDSHLRHNTSLCLRLGVFAVATTDGVSVFTPTKIYATKQQVDGARSGSEEGWLSAEKTQLTHDIVVEGSVPQGVDSVKETHAHAKEAIRGIADLSHVLIWAPARCS